MAFPTIDAGSTSGEGKDKSLSITLPSGLATGDRVIIIAQWQNDGSPTSYPAGWTSLINNDNTSGSDSQIHAAYRDCDGTEPSSITFSMDSARDTGWRALLLKGCDLTEPPTVSTYSRSATSSNTPNDVSWAWSGDTLAITQCHVLSSVRDTTPTGYTMLTDVSINAGSSWLQTGHKDVTSSPESPAAFGFTGSANSGSVTIAVKGTGAGGGASVDVPAADIGVGANAPTVSTGASVAVPAADVSVAALAPTVSTGVNIIVPTADVSIAALPPSIATGAAVAVPAANINVEGLAPSVSAATGVAINVPAANVEVSALPPTIQTGVNVEVPAADIAVEALAPTVTATEGVSVNVPAANINIIAFPPTITAASGQVAPRRVGSGYSKDHEQGRERTERDRKTTRETRRQAVERAFKALEPQQVQEVVEAQEPLPVSVQEDIAQAALIDLGDAEASLNALMALVNEIWAQRLEEIYEDEAIELLLLAS